MRTLAFASSNSHKLKEAQEILSEWKLVSPADLGILDFHPEETGTTFLENARIKSTALFQLTRLPSIADDSGLEVYALGGEPGVYSARYGGENLSDRQRAERILTRMQGVRDRRARFQCVIYFVSELGERAFTGTVEGIIGESYVEGNGFGYDPIFFYPPLNKCFSELTPQEKNKISHRARALREFAESSIDF